MSENVSPRAAKRAQEEKALQEKKRYNITVTAIVAVVIVLALFAGFFGSNLFYNKTTAVKAGSEKFTVADFNYNYFSVYNSFYSSYGDMAQYILPAGTPLRETVYNNETGETWADFFEEQALSRISQVAMLNAEAAREGFLLPPDQRTSVDDTVSGLTSTALSQGFASLDAYLSYCYGKGMTEKVFRENLSRDVMANAYSDYKLNSFTYTPEQITSHYAENSDDFDFITYRIYSFSANAVTDNTETEEDETLSAEDAKARALEDANAFKAAVTDEQSFIDYAASLNTDDEDYDADASTKTSVQGSNLSDPAKSWLIDASRREGDVEVLETAEDAASQNVYVLYYIGRDSNQYQAVSGYYGIVAKDDTIVEDNYDSHEAYEAAVQAAAEETAQGVLDTFATSGNLTEDGFAEVLSLYTETVTSSNALTSVGKYDVPEALAAWLSDPERKEGDTTKIYDESYGCFVLFFTSQDGIYADLLSENDLRSDDYSAWQTAALENYKTDTQWEMFLSKKITALGG